MKRDKDTAPPPAVSHRTTEHFTIDAEGKFIYENLEGSCRQLGAWHQFVEKHKNGETAVFFKLPIY